MTISIDRRALRSAFVALNRTRGDNKTARVAPQATGYRVTVEQDALLFVTFNGTTATEIAVPVAHDGQLTGETFVLPYDVRKAKLGRADMVTLDARPGRVTLADVEVSAKVPSDWWAPVDEMFRLGEDVECVEIPAFPAKRLCAFVSRDALRPAMQGVYVDTVNGALVSSDGHRLHMAPRDLPSDVEPFILRPDGLETLDGSTVSVSIGAEVGSFNARGCLVSGCLPVACAVLPSVRVASRTIGERYPNWRGVMPDTRDGGAWLTVERDALVSALDNAKKGTSGMTRQIRLYAEDGTLHVSGENIEAGHVAYSRVACEGHLCADMEGTPRAIGFNVDYLTESVQGCGETIRLHTSSPNRAASIVCDTEWGQAVTLTMPVMLNVYGDSRDGGVPRFFGLTFDRDTPGAVTEAEALRIYAGVEVTEYPELEKGHTGTTREVAGTGERAELRATVSREEGPDGLQWECTRWGSDPFAEPTTVHGSEYAAFDAAVEFVRTAELVMNSGEGNAEDAPAVGNERATGVVVEQTQAGYADGEGCVPDGTPEVQRIIGMPVYFEGERFRAYSAEGQAWAREGAPYVVTEKGHGTRGTFATAAEAVREAGRLENGTPPPVGTDPSPRVEMDGTPGPCGLARVATLDTSEDALCAAFGAPCTFSPDEDMKVSREWSGTVLAGGVRMPVTVYDYKGAEWSIGGDPDRAGFDLAALVSALAEVLDRTGEAYRITDNAGDVRAEGGDAPPVAHEDGTEPAVMTREAFDSAYKPVRHFQRYSSETSNRLLDQMGYPSSLAA